MNSERTPSRSELARASRIQRGLEVRAGWWDRLLEMPVLWGTLAVVLSWWMLLPSGARKLPEWAPGEVATFDVVVPTDLTVPDEPATERLREEARAQVPPVYDLDPRVGSEAQEALGDVLERCRAALATEAEAGAVEEMLTGSMELDVSAEAASVLVQEECSPRLEEVMEDAVARIYRSGVVADLRGLERRGELVGVTLRNLASDVERQVSLGELGEVIDSASVDATARDILVESDFIRRRWLKPLSELLAFNLAPNLDFNRAEWQQRVEAAASAVQQRSQVFKRGQVLVRRGDTVNEQVADALRLFDEGRNDLERFARAVGILLLMLMMVSGWARLLTRLTGTAERRQRLSVIFVLMILVTAAERSGVYLASAIALNAQNAAAADPGVYLWALPHATGAVAALMLLGLQPAVLFAVCQALIAGLMLGGDFTVVVYALGSGMVAAMATQQFMQRAVFTRAGVAVGVANLALFVVLQLFETLPGTPRQMFIAAVCAFVGGPLAVSIISFVLPLLEDAFGITTDIRLLELSNQNLPLLKRLSLEAPGTYQHSLAVGNLAEAGCDAIGANSLLVRVCAYYHDIGKLVKPEYFVENQRKGSNPHDNLSPSMSALVIISHVKEGLRMAREAKLPLPIRQAIATHHGTKHLHYFYRKAVDATGEGMTQPQESDYRYPGPKPFTKELGVLLVADGIEAASRTLESPTPSRLQDLVDRLIRDALEDGQLDQTELTFKELERVGSAFLWVLTSMYHHRLDYPGFDFNRKEGARDSGVHQLGTKTRDASG